MVIRILLYSQTFLYKKEVVLKVSITIINRDSELGLTQKKLEGLKKYSEIIQYGRKHPAWFAETFLGVTFMDYQ